jgi:hypothetical protein
MFFLLQRLDLYEVAFKLQLLKPTLSMQLIPSSNSNFCNLNVTALCIQVIDQTVTTSD